MVGLNDIGTIKAGTITNIITNGDLLEQGRADVSPERLEENPHVSDPVG
jgi:hypothetical protein